MYQLGHNLASSYFISMDNGQPVTPGVFITHHHILTSFNPYREKYREPLKDVQVIILIGRKLESSEGRYQHETVKAPVKCARQAVPIPESLLTQKQWHGLEKAHSPLHDLLILKIDMELNFLDPDPEKSFQHISEGSSTPAGPMVTNVAKPDDKIFREVKFASLGFRNKRHILINRELRSREYDSDENALGDCDQWFPKLWGRFICINNVDKYKGVGSGALLVYNDTLFGVGSFVLRKGAQSILVFTDVRPYYNILFNICNGENY